MRREGERKEGKTRHETQSPALILPKTNRSRVNIFELKSSKVEINGCACVGPTAVSAFLSQSKREAKKRNERERSRRREQLKRKTGTRRSRGKRRNKQRFRMSVTRGGKEEREDKRRRDN